MMELKINIKVCKRTFALFFATLIVIFLLVLNYGRTNMTLMAVQTYSNCTCPSSNYFPYTYHSFNLSNITGNYTFNKGDNIVYVGWYNEKAG